MAKIPGRYQEADWNSNALNGIIDGSLETSVEELDTTSHDDGGDRTYIAGRSSHSLSFSFHYNEADTGQAGLLADVVSRTTRAFAFRMEDSGGLIEYTGNGLATSVVQTGSNDGVAEMTATIRVTGALTKGTV